MNTEQVKILCKAAVQLSIEVAETHNKGDARQALEILNTSFVDLMKSLNPMVQFYFKVDDVRSQRPGLHLELCKVSLGREDCTISLPHEWFEPGSPRLRGLLPRLFPVSLYVGDMAMTLERKLSFIFEVGDNGYLPSMSFSSKNHYGCLVPDWDFVASGGYDDERCSFEIEGPTWEKRLRKVFWRGNTTGQRRFNPPGEGQPDDFRWLQRLWLCRSAHQSSMSRLCDIRLSGICQMPEQHLYDRIVAAGYLGEYVPKMRFASYTVIVDIDGNSNAWRGLMTALLSGGCVLKIQSERAFRQWYYNQLVPFDNYIPVNWDFTDFDDALRWIEASGHRVAEVAASGLLLSKRLTFDACIQDARKGLSTWLSTSTAVDRP